LAFSSTASSTLLFSAARRCASAAAFGSTMPVESWAPAVTMASNTALGLIWRLSGSFSPFQLMTWLYE
jgi:hypothetical protein